MISLTTSLLLAPFALPVQSTEASTSDAPRDFSYTFVDARVGYESNDDQTEAGGTLDLRASLEIFDPIYVGVRYRGFELDLPAGSDPKEISTNALHLTVGYHAPVGPRTDFLADLSWVNYDRTTISAGGFDLDEDDTETVIGTSLRHMLTPLVELEARVQYSVDLRAALLEVGPRIQVSDSFQLGLVYENGTTPEGRTGSSVLLGARLAF